MNGSQAAYFIGLAAACYMAFWLGVAIVKGVREGLSNSRTSDPEPPLPNIGRRSPWPGRGPQLHSTNLPASGPPPPIPNEQSTPTGNHPFVYLQSQRQGKDHPPRDSGAPEDDVDVDLNRYP